jgi:ribosome-associated toxin RatA of RatAB toxin-antitoxin module
VESTLAIDIAAPPAAVLALASAVEDWPRILPHYRWVRIRGREGARVIADMSARRTMYPVRWTAVVEPRPERGVLRFDHIGGPTRGMEVEWRLTPTASGTRVALWHRFHSRLPVIAPLYDWVVQHVFIEHIAGKTLRCMKREAEARAAGPAIPSISPVGEVQR